MKYVAFGLLCLLLHLSSTACEELGSVFLVLMTSGEASGNRGSFTLEDNYCLDPVLPRAQSSCRIRVLAPQGSVYSESRIHDMTLDFQHPSRPDTACHVRWPRDGDVRTWCERNTHPLERRVGLLAFRAENVTSGSIKVQHLLQSEKYCDYKVYRIEYYRDGLDGSPERIPTVFFRTAMQGCVAGIVSGRRVNNYRTTEAPCVYNRRRLCRPLTQAQYDSMIRDIEANEIYADFRTTSDRPHLRP